MANEKIKISETVLELPAKQHCQFSPFGPTSEVNGLDWQCCLAGSSKTAPRILIFSIAIDTDYSYEVKNSEIWVPAFFKHNNSFIAAVRGRAATADFWQASGFFSCFYYLHILLRKQTFCVDQYNFFT